MCVKCHDGAACSTAQPHESGACKTVTSGTRDKRTSQELQGANLGHSGRGGARGEAIALVLALMAEAYAGTESRCCLDGLAACGGLLVRTHLLM